MAAAEGISAKTTSDLDRLGRQAHGRRGSGGQLYLRRYRPLDLAAAAPVRPNDLAATSPAE